MDEKQTHLYKDLPLNVIADSKEILDSLKSTLATTKINALFTYLRGGEESDLMQTENLNTFLKKCVTREIVDKVKDSRGIEETEEEYKERISKEEYNTAKITEDIRLGLDEKGQVHFYVKFGKEKIKECEVTTEDTLTVVRSVYRQFIIDLEEQEKMLLEYALSESSFKKTLGDEEKDKEIDILKSASEEMQKKNDRLQEELRNSQLDMKLAKEEKERKERELEAQLDKNKHKLRQINLLLTQKVQKEAAMQINMMKLEGTIAELRKSLLEAEKKNKELEKRLVESKHDEKLSRAVTKELEENLKKMNSLRSSLAVFGGFVSQCLNFNVNHLIKK